MSYYIYLGPPPSPSKVKGLEDVSYSEFSGLLGEAANAS
jgi:hypothetical protein